MIITIDGPSGTGKSTVAKGVAKKLGFTFFDTGAMYRSMAWWLNRSGIDLDNLEEITLRLPEFNYEIQGSGFTRKYFVNAIDVSEAIRSHEISHLASKIAVYAPIRQILVEIQRKFGTSVDAVFEGRDMGTVVFPDADVKIFLTAKPEVRANRRFLELKTKNPAGIFSETQILQDLEERDLKDSTRTLSPLKQATDATLIDTSTWTAEEVIEQIVALILRKNGES
jgi:cytidylate kinase